MAVQAEKSDNRETFLSELEVLKRRFESMKPELEVTLRDPAMNVEGYVVVWNTGISEGGPLEYSGKGGTRITDTLSLDEVKMLARTMALKNAAAGLPLGGSKAGMKANSSVEGFEAQYRRFVSLCKPFLHENGGIFGGFGFDIGARPEMPHWACDELGSRRSFTGKPVDMGGTDYDREGIAGLGVAIAGKTLIECAGEEVVGKRFAVQGLGAMGAAVFRYFTEYGGQLSALGDPKFGGSWRFENGVSEDLKQALITMDADTAKALIEAEGTQISDSPEHVLYEPVDILFPCAIQGVIRDDNVHKLQARYITEGANQPITADTYPMLQERGIPTVPDFIANPGGIIAAFVELTSASEDKVKEAKELTISKISQNVRDMMALAENYDVEPVHAGMHLALNRIFGL